LCRGKRRDQNVNRGTGGPPGEGKACATAAAALHPPISANDDGENRCESSNSMRAEIQSLVDEIKQSLGLLRRHL
jgi:hypothetical protein